MGLSVSKNRGGCPPRVARPFVALAVLALLAAGGATPAAAQTTERMYFPAVENVREVLVGRIKAETVRVDMSAWYLTEGAIVTALIDKHKEGVPIRLIGDRGSIFEIDQKTKDAFYKLADAGVPIRLRYHPTFYPEIAHWKATIFAGQNVITFGSANYTPFELAPVSSTNYKDETVLFTDDPVLVGAFKTKFDVMWNDTTKEPYSRISGPPYFLNWHDACKKESACADFYTLYPSPQPMIVDTARLEPDNPLPPEMVWGQGPVFNDRLVKEIKNEASFVDFVIYRLTVDNITNAVLEKHNAGVPVRIIMEPNEYRNRKWPEFWITHANIDKLWAAGVKVKKRVHDGLTHMKMLVTSSYATNASSNLAAAWQRDHNYFVPAATKPAIYGAMRDRFNIMWSDTAGFADFVPEPPDAPKLASPASSATGVSTSATLSWNRAAFAVSYDIYLGKTSGSMVKVGNVAAKLVNDPPPTYSWTTPTALEPATTYYWKVVSLTNATPIDPTMIASSSTWNFTTEGTAAPPATPGNPSPADGATDVGLTPQLTWSQDASASSYSVAFGTSNPPPTVASGLTSAAYSPGTLAQKTTYYWQVTASNSYGNTTGPVWSFTTGSVPPEVVIHAADITTLAGAWTKVADTTAAGGTTLRHPDNGWSATTNALGSPTHYFEVTFDAVAATRYRVWLRLRAKDNSKYNDSVYVQFSDAIDSAGNAVYRTGTTSALVDNLWTCATCASSGWGWSRHAYWLSDTGEVWFPTSGTRTIRVQTREDGVDVDQIVISPVAYVESAPGPVKDDTTIVAKPAEPTAAPPATPSSPSPTDGATGVSVNPTLTWAADGATSYDVSFGTTNPPPQVSSGQTTASFKPPTLEYTTTYYWRIVAHNANGTTAGPVWTFTTQAAPPAEIVIYAGDIADGAVHGAWSKVSDATAAEGVTLATPDNGFAATSSPLASPTHYVDVTFNADKDVPYRIWLRVKALNNNKYNDAVWVQFSDALVNRAQVYPLNTTSGLLVNLATDSTASSLSDWGWQNTAYWLSQPTTVTFANAGSHTLRIQVREDGVMFDQIVLSPSSYLTAAPGPVSNDATIVPKP